MAKDKVNKSALVREMMAANPKATAKEIVDKMAEKGHKVTANLVYFLRMKGNNKKKRAVKQKVQASANGQDPLAIIRQVKGLAEQVGGFAQLKEIVEAMA